MKSLFLFFFIMLQFLQVSYSQDHVITGELGEGEFLLFSAEKKTGLMDADKNILIPAEWDRIEMSHDFSLFECYLGKTEYRYYTYSGQAFADSLIFTGPAVEATSGGWFLHTTNGTGLIVGNFEFIIPPIYDRITEGMETYHECYITYLVEKDGKLGIYIDSVLALPVAFDALTLIDLNRTFYAVKDGKYGMYAQESNCSKAFKELLPVEYDNVFPVGQSEYSEINSFALEKNKLMGLAAIQSDNNECKSHILSVPKYNKIDFKKEIRLENDWYLLPVVKGKENYHLLYCLSGYTQVDTAKQTSVSVLSYKAADGGYFIFKNNKGKWGAVELSIYGMQQLIPFEYDQILTFEEFRKDLPDGDGYLAVQKNNKWGLSTYDHEIMVDIMHDQLSDIPLDGL